MTGFRYQKANVKLEQLEKKVGGTVYSASLPSGYSCPSAVDCLSKSDRDTGKVTDGKLTEFRCFMATGEARSTGLRNIVWNNFDLVRKAKTRQGIYEVMHETFPHDASAIRMHVGGDMYNAEYFGAWIDLAKAHPYVLFYGYTKSIHLWVQMLDQIPDNMELTGSKGGTHDYLLEEYNLKTSHVVYHPDEADAMGLEIDHDDSHALYPTGSFALLIHGTQPKGSVASEALKRLRAENIQYAYSK